MVHYYQSLTYIPTITLTSTAIPFESHFRPSLAVLPQALPSDDGDLRPAKSTRDDQPDLEAARDQGRRRLVPISSP